MNHAGFVGRPGAEQLIALEPLAPVVESEGLTRIDILGHFQPESIA